MYDNRLQTGRISQNTLYLSHIMTISQIAAIIQLLIAFSVPQPTVNTVQAILEHSQKVPNSIEIPLQNAGGVSAIITRMDTPTVVASVVKMDGTIETGIDFMFTATTTLPIGYVQAQNAEVVLQTPTIRYHGPYSSWKENKQIKETATGFVFTSGWGTGSGITPAGTFIFSANGATTTTSI